MIKNIPVPKSVNVTINDLIISCEGPLGTLNLEIPKSISLSQEKGNLVLSQIKSIRLSSKKSKAIFNTFCSTINNTFKGICTGHSKQLNLVGVGYRIEDVGQDKFSLKLGYSNPIILENDSDATISVLKPTIIQVKGINKQKVSSKAAEIYNLRPPEPYKGKGVLYKGKSILRKEGKKLS